jgi:hypothetical protein
MVQSFRVGRDFVPSGDILREAQAIKSYLTAQCCDSDIVENLPAAEARDMMVPEPLGIIRAAALLRW